MLAPSVAPPVAALPLAGKVALVTGGSRGIGRAIALDLARHGADVAFTFAKDEAAAASVSREADAADQRAVALRADGRSDGDVRLAVAAAVDRFGALDILVNNAGITHDRVIWKMTDAEWNDVLDADLTACFRYMRAAIPIFRERGGGRIVSISSINAQRGKFGQANYTASKAGIIGLSKTVAREVGQYGITVNVITPGLIATQLVAAAPEEVRTKALAEIVLGRLGAPEDVAALVTFLASDRARHITGAVIPVDGGQYL
ncbi:MAG TPA: beta-ketoacyl-ACP reductase [Chloroflexi bacterium]|jgi:3-oxoacyl-[acyl-carrier protein] reductase|nr:beta-ketoacyl-ACP reductase [Chloroflexota bacterium]HAL28527.1 beta-ketoacyl-ACP reductase [Chloroflexota bacterium]